MTKIENGFSEKLKNVGGVILWGWHGVGYKIGGVCLYLYILIINDINKYIAII